MRVTCRAHHPEHPKLRCQHDRCRGVHIHHVQRGVDEYGVRDLPKRTLYWAAGGYHRRDEDHQYLHDGREYSGRMTPSFGGSTKW